MGFLSATANNKLPIFLSGGVDSTLLGLMGWYLGLEPICISYEREGVYSRDCEQAEKTCKILGWEFHKVIIPKENPRDIFEKLVYEYGVNKKTELEVLYPFLSMFQKCKELGLDKIVCGFNPSPDNRKHAVWNKKNSKEFWDYIVNNNITSDASKKIVAVAKEMGIIICCPLQGKTFKETLYGLSDNDMNKPYNKSFYKDCFPEKFEKIGMMKVKNEPLQKGGSMTDFFEPIIFDKEINFKNYKTDDVTKCLTSLTRLHSTLDEKKIKKHQKSNEAHRLWISKNLRNYADAKNIINFTPDDGKIIKFEPYKMKDVYESSSRELFTVVSTFAGGGGSSTGYRLAGGKVLLINEFIPEAIKTYSMNFPDTPIDGSDIRKITKSGKGEKGIIEWFNSYGIEKNELDILDGSPPCSTFSQVGKGEKKIEQKNVKYSDTVQDDIGLLIYEFVELAHSITPRIIILENVPEIQTSAVFEDSLQKLRDKFFVNFKVLKSSNFGVPQKRRRLFLVGVRKDIAIQTNIESDNDILSLYPKGSSFETSLYDALQGVELNKKEVNLTKRKCRTSTAYEILKLIPTDPSENYRANYDNPEFKNLYFNTNRAAFHQPINTLTQTGAQLKNFGGQYHPLENRTFTLNELKRLTSLPDDFKLSGSFNQRAERIGRMVPPLLTKHLVESLYNKVLNPLSR